MCLDYGKGIGFFESYGSLVRWTVAACPNEVLLLHGRIAGWWSVVVRRMDGREVVPPRLRARMARGRRLPDVRRRGVRLEAGPNASTSASGPVAWDGRDLSFIYLRARRRTQGLSSLPPEGSPEGNGLGVPVI